MSAVIVDTSSWISYFAGRPVLGLEDSLRDARVHLPGLVAAELLSGRLRAAQRRELFEFLQYLPLCDLSLPHWSRVGRLRASLAMKGLTISTPDAHVAQCCLDLDAALLTEDRIFRRIAEFTPLRVA